MTLPALSLAAVPGRRRATIEIAAAWRESGCAIPILVPSSATGNQMAAFDEVFSAFA